MNRVKTIVACLASLTLCFASCGKRHDDSQKDRDESSKTKVTATSASEPAPEPAAVGGMPMEEMKEAIDSDQIPGTLSASKPAPMKSDERLSEGYGGGSDKLMKKGRGGGGEQGPLPRAWFPETFLFAPLIITDDSGQASVDVRVPDRLTTWRVLGLAHSRNGSQAGATATFAGTLPAYVDPVVPSFLRAGDMVRVPVQLINNTDNAMETTLTVAVEGGTIKNGSQSVTVPARGGIVRYVEVLTEQAGQLRLLARMGDQDMVVRTIEVQPTGKPALQSKSGTLAAPRKFSLVGADVAGASKGVASVSVFPGALSLLRSELSGSVHRGGVAADAFALLLAGKAPKLLRRLGDEPDEKALREMTITTTQKIMKHARVLSIENATLIAEAARAHTDNPVLERLGQRAISTIESSQSPDGTCGGQRGWTLQRLLVATADCARAAHDAPNVTIRAGGAFERNSKEISDPYTAAAILAAHAATGELESHLRELVLAGIVEQENGAKILSVPSGVVRADGMAPSVVEATALAVLALADVPDAPLADLGATILASYSPHWGWGDGRANLVCMEAAIELFDEPLPESVKVELSQDGEVLAQGTLTRDKVREVLELRAEGLDIGGSHEWSIAATPSIPGLGFSFRVTNWVPWTEEETLGTELQIDVPDLMVVGQSAKLAVQAIAPSGRSFVIEVALPTGVQLDDSALDALVQSSVLERYKKVDGKLTMYVSPLQPAKRFATELRIIPTMAGRLQSGPATINVGTQTGTLPPVTYRVNGAN